MRTWRPKGRCRPGYLGSAPHAGPGGAGMGHRRPGVGGRARAGTLAHGTALMICWPWGAFIDTNGSEKNLENIIIKSDVGELSYTELPGVPKAASTEIHAPCTQKSPKS